MSSDKLFSHRRPDSHFDSAFDPEQNFMFEEATNEEELHNMQNHIASLQMMQSDSSHELQTSFMNSIFFDQGDLSPTSHGWPGGQPLDGFPAQTSAFTSGVVRQFGQITPPDEGTPKFSPPKRRQIAEAQDKPASSAKSERARNAANQRHAKAKKARKDSVRDIQDADDDQDDVDDKKERYREKNRLAAAKCRSKKKTHTEGLEESARFITAQNNKLRAEERELRDMFSSLRHQALAHDPTQGCTCKAIHMYNNNKAQEAARGAAMHFAAHSVPSPSIGSNRSAVASPVDVGGVANRTHSFSGARPTFSKPPTRLQSVSGSLEQESSSTGILEPSPVVAGSESWGLSPPDESSEEFQSMSLDQHLEFN